MAAGPDLAAIEQAEIEIIEAYLPKQMDDSAVAAAVAAAISETGAASVKDMGKVMGVLKAKYAGQMDFQKASAAVKGGARLMSCTADRLLQDAGKLWKAGTLRATRHWTCEGLGRITY